MKLEKTGNEESPIAKTLAWILDDLIKIPGTDKRIGLDPLLGLIPGVGDFLSSGAGLAILAAGAKKNIPKTVYLRMASNWALNALIGAIPVIGDAFSFWFKSNRRNHSLLSSYANNEITPGAARSSWWPFIILISAVCLVLGSFLLIAAALAKYVFTG